MWSQASSPDAGWKSGGLGISVQYRPDTGLRAVTGEIGKYNLTRLVLDSPESPCGYFTAF